MGLQYIALFTAATMTPAAMKFLLTVQFVATFTIAIALSSMLMFQELTTPPIFATALAAVDAADVADTVAAATNAWKLWKAYVERIFIMYRRRKNWVLRHLV